MFVTEAFAQSAGGGGSTFISLLPFIGIMAIMYFLLIRPQQKKAKQHREMVAALRRGDTVVTAGGVIAKVNRVNDEEDQLLVEIADKIEVKIVRSTVTAVVAKSEPAAEATDK